MMINLILLRAFLALVLFTGACSSLSAKSCLSGKKVCVVGGGPCGLFLSNLLLKSDPSVRVQVLEKAPSYKQGFGFGISERAKHSLQQVSGLFERIEEVSVPVKDTLRVVQRSALCECMLDNIGRDEDRFQIDYNVNLSKIDLQAQTVTTTSTSSKRGGDISYDLLVGADGIDSMVREAMVAEKQISQEHYLHPGVWKVMTLPPQDDIEPNDFRPLSHADFNGALLPKNYEGHVLLIFWRPGDSTSYNPGGVEAKEEFAEMIRWAIKGKTSKLDWILRRNKDDDLKIKFDDAELARFLTTKPKKVHYVKLDQYHGPNVALIGDAAHGMYSFLGQGCACGLENTLRLANSLATNEKLPTALETYSTEAVPEGHAITDLDLVAHVIDKNTLGLLVALPLILIQAVQGKMLFQRVGEPNVTYQDIIKDNRLLVKWSQIFWRRQRLSIE